MELYVHIPFCIKKCYYCDFLSMPADDTVKKQYVQALKNEIMYNGKMLAGDGSVIDSGDNGVLAAENTVLKTIYFGGGTPSVLPTDFLIELLTTIRQSFVIQEDAEITIEINPATITYDGLHNLRKAGFNRLSIGLQSVHNDKLKQLGRIHTYEQFLETYHNARKAGFDNINVDCISALPGQTLEEYISGLHKIAKLKPEHLSSYSLILEEGTLFYDWYADAKELLPDEDTDRAMYHETDRILKAYGYERYEISNYAKKGFESKHNSGYWRREPYIGVGLGAASFLKNRRTKNVTDIKDYILLWRDCMDNCMDDKESSEVNIGLHNINSINTLKEDYILKNRYVENDMISKTDAMAEFFFLGLRMSEGVSVRQFEAEFGCTVYERYGEELKELEREKLIEIDADKGMIRLTEYGMDISNWVFEKFI